MRPNEIWKKGIPHPRTLHLFGAYIFIRNELIDQRVYVQRQSEDLRELLIPPGPKNRIKLSSGNKHPFLPGAYSRISIPAGLAAFDNRSDIILRPHRYYVF